MAGPEATTSTATEPEAYSADQLSDPVEFDAIDRDYSAELTEKAPFELQELIDKGVREGVFVRDTSEEARPDDLFDGTEIKPADPLGKDLLARIREQQARALKEDHVIKIEEELQGLTPDRRADRLASLLEDDLRQGKVDITVVPVERQKAVNDKSPGPRKYTEQVPRLTAKDGRAHAIKLAYEDAGVKLSGSDREMWKGLQIDLSKRVGALRETERKRVDIEHNKREQAAKADEARRALEQADRKAQSEQEAELGGISYETKKVYNRKNRTYEDGFVVDKSGNRVLDRSNEGYQAAHEQALEENRGFDRLKKYGTTEDAIDKARTEATAINDNLNMLADADAENDRRTANAADRARERAAGMLRTATPDRATDPDGYQAELNDSHERALLEDANATAQAEIYRQYQDQIDALGKAPDPEVRKHLEGLRDQAVATEKQRQIDRDKQMLDIRFAEMPKTAEFKDKAGRHEAYHETISMADPKAEAKAMERRTQLGLEPVPFLETRSGGLLHRKKNRGPKVVESYFRVAGQENLVVVERRKRRSGDLVSQTILTTEQPIRHRGDIELPPKEVMKTMVDVRAHDHEQMAASANNSARDYVSGFRLGEKFDGSSGVYAGYESSAPLPGGTSTASRRGAWRSKGPLQRRGGWLFWMRGDR